MTTKQTPPIPRWLLFQWAVTVIAFIALSLVPVFGDPGTSNVIKLALLLVTAAISLMWFAIFSPWSRRVRYGGVLSLLLAMVLLSSLFEIRGMTGSLVPVFAPRWASSGAKADLSAVATKAVDLETTTPFDFAGFLGNQRDLQVQGITLDTDLENNPQQQLWKQPIGEGLGGFAVVNGYAATLEQREDGEWTTLYDVETGDVVWATKIDDERFESVVAKNGPRSTPAIDGGRVYVLGVNGALAALDGSTGKPVWERNLRQEAGLTVDDERGLLTYGRPNSPLVHDELLIVPVGGKAGAFVSVTAFNKNTGETVWSSGNQQISGSSPNVAVLGGVEQVLVLSEGSANGYDLNSGEVLWSIPWPGRTNADTSSSQIVPVDSERVFLSRGYGTGGALHRLVPNSAGTFDTEPVWESARVLRTKFSNVAVHEGHLYGLSEGVLECVDLETGERVWKAGRYGHGQMLIVDNVLVILSEDGEIFYIRATPDERNQVLAEFQALDGQTWNNFAIYGDIVLVRNGREAAAYRVPLAD